MSIDAISSLATARPSPALLAAARTAERSDPGSPLQAEDVKKAARQFEAILMRQLLAPAIEPMMNGSLGGASTTGGGVYGYMLTDVLANSITQGGGLGLASVIESQLSPRAGSRPAPDSHE
jgi:Rod binding domain-containing protein